MAVPVCGRSGLWPFRFVAVPVCGHFGLWPFRFVAVPVCGLSGLWPFRYVAVSFLAVSVCGRYDQNPSCLYDLKNCICMDQMSYGKRYIINSYPYENSIQNYHGS